MPIYEYACPVCHTRFERLQPMGHADETSCPDCGGAANRVLSVFAAVSRGEGGETSAVAGCGGACACAAGGACGCGE